MHKLKNCPFCGGAVTLEKTMHGSSMGPRDWWGVKCRNTMNRGGTCAIEQIPSGSVEAAVERWNRRAPRATADVERDEALEAAAEIAEGWSTGAPDGVDIAQQIRSMKSVAATKGAKP